LTGWDEINVVDIFLIAYCSKQWDGNRQKVNCWPSDTNANNLIYVVLPKVAKVSTVVNVACSWSSHFCCLNVHN